MQGRHATRLTTVGPSFAGVAYAGVGARRMPMEILVLMRARGRVGASPAECYARAVPQAPMRRSLRERGAPGGAVELLLSLAGLRVSRHGVAPHRVRARRAPSPAPLAGDSSRVEGTGQALRIAHGIGVINLAHPATALAATLAAGP